MPNRFREHLSTALLPHAEAIATFEAPESQAGVPAGARRDYIRFQALISTFLSELAERLAAEYGGGIFAAGGKKFWRKIGHRSRFCYVPCGAPDFGVGIARTPKWLSRQLSWPNIATPGIHNQGKKAIFSFWNVVGFGDASRPGHCTFIESVTGKSSDGEKLDGNAHERLSYKILQYIEMMQSAEGGNACELFVFGNGAFSQYRNRFYPSTQRHLKRMAAVFEGFRAELAVGVDEYMALTNRILDWLGDRSPAVMLRAPRPRPS